MPLIDNNISSTLNLHGFCSLVNYFYTLSTNMIPKCPRIVIIMLTFATLLIHSCNHQPATINNQFPPLMADSFDIDGGQWKTVLINTDSIKVPVPASTDSKEYQHELVQLKNVIQKRTYAQEQAINYWASGGVLRWNQIARELVAKYNHGTATPVASPPFASRLYALLSVAQYDALVATWNFKYKYRRLSPTHNGIASFLPQTELPSYPSEDAVIATVSYRILSKLFPLEEKTLYQRALEHGNTRLWSGANVKSDIMMGSFLAEQVAQKVIAYANNDDFKKANDPQALWKKNIGKITQTWKSQDNPPHEPLLPMMGLVKTWFAREEVLKEMNETPPPALNSEAFRKDIDSVKKIGQNRTPEQKRIADFWADGNGTFTPPGHWNQIAEGLIRKYHLTELKTAQILQLLNRAQEDAAVACWATKYKYLFPRPSQVDTTINHSLSIPNFPSYTSGHATFSAAAAYVLSDFFPEEANNLKKMANEAGISRVYGGIHYLCDNEGGKMCGEKIGKMAVSWQK